MLAVYEALVPWSRFSKIYFNDVLVLYRHFPNKKALRQSPFKFFNIKYGQLMLKIGSIISMVGLPTTEIIEPKSEDIFGFSKEIFYSQAVQSVFNSSELKILNCFYTDNLIYVLTILYKTNLSEECKQLTMDVNSELRKNGVSLLRFKKRINFKKYVLYKLGLLKLVFDLRLRMKRYR
ncbi:hypothetical protein [Streptococcus thermophilus]|uniref:hypothetical protein n=1 Tax=Streptococcus thermophilus TaxID=1308 RepID=UPI00338EF12E